MAGAERSVLFSCEHGGRLIPREHRALFRGRKRLLASHRGWDPGALALARLLADALDAPLIAATTTRLLVDLNRSPHNPAVFSEITRGLPPAQKQMLLARFHRDHWDRVRAFMTARRGAVLHIGVHSFTPVWREKRRDFEVGILYDPKRSRERLLAVDWQRGLRQARPDLRVRRNAPYRGNADGLTTALRKDLPPHRYLGLELELNQRAIPTAGARRALATLLAHALRGALEARAKTRHPCTSSKRV